jgi:hypothetical protein
MGERLYKFWIWWPVETLGSRDRVWNYYERLSDRGYAGAVTSVGREYYPIWEAHRCNDHTDMEAFFHENEIQWNSQSPTPDDVRENASFSYNTGAANICYTRNPLIIEPDRNSGNYSDFTVRKHYKKGYRPN